MRQRRVDEDILPKKMSVRFSAKVTSKIDSIISRNQNNKQAISQWLEYLETVKNYVSNPVIAWDYTDRNVQFPNGARYIRDFDFNIGYSIIADYTTDIPFVYIFMVNLNHHEFGLKESTYKGEVIAITETDLRKMVKECIRKVIQENIDERMNRKYGVNGYYIEKNGMPIIYKGQEMKSVISVVYKDGGQAYHICEDDHCYVFYVSTNGVKKAERYENPYIFDELLEAIKMLPIPS